MRRLKQSALNVRDSCPGDSEYQGFFISIRERLELRVAVEVECLEASRHQREVSLKLSPMSTDPLQALH